MDNRLYHYQYRRPRHTNRTYQSNNVNNSMTFFMNGPSSPSRRSAYQEQFRTSSSRQPQPFRSESQLQTGTRYDTKDQYFPQDPRQRTRSNLSSYGTNSLAFNQRDIYDKQNSQFNIISLKPKQVPDHIKVYPKLTLQDKDSFYYQKMQKVRDHETNMQQTRNGSLPSRNPQVAGKHTFMPQENKNANYYQHGRYFTPKMLNHADQVSNIM